MKQLLVIVLISLFLPSCGRREICFLNARLTQVTNERDSLEKLLYLTRAFHARKDTLSPLKYYIIGSEDELMRKGIIKRVSGISREFKISNSIQKFHFLYDHYQNLDSIIVRGKQVRILGSFAPESYILIGSDKDDYHVLIIKDKELFWSQNLFLIVTHK